MTLIHTYGSLVYRDVVERQVDGGSFLRYPHRTVVVARPSRGSVQRIYVLGGGVGVERDALYDVAARLQYAGGSCRERQITALVETHEVFHRDAELLHEVIR